MGYCAAMPVIRVPFEVEPNYDGWRLDRYLQQKIRRLSRAHIQRLIRERMESDRPLKPASPVRPGQRFALLKDVDDEPEPPSPPDVRIVHDDTHLLAVNKPPYLAVHPSSRYVKHTLTQWLADHARNAEGRRPDLAHRLDRETSGVVACGRTLEATRALKLAFARRQTEKWYLAVAQGRVERDSFVVDVPLRLDTEDIKCLMEVAPEGGLPSTTAVRVLRRGRLHADGAPVTLLECAPRTGRQHQIRVHLEHVGHPLVGDKIYGGDRERFLRWCAGALTPEDLAALRMPRQALHAWRLALPHPATGARLLLEAPPAEDLASFCRDSVQWEAWSGEPVAGL